MLETQSSDHSDLSSGDHLNETLTSDDLNDAPPSREGLPPDFRMRADAHYVDLLEAPRHGHDAASAGVDRVWPEAVVTAATAAGGSELARSLSAIRACADLLLDPVSEFTRAVAADLVRAELCRAGCLLQSLRMLRAELMPRRTPVAVQPLVGRVLDAVEPERRLRSVAINRRLTLSHGRIHADEELLVCALSGVILATLALVEGTNAEVTVLARLDPGGDFTFSVTQDHVALPAAWLHPVAQACATGTPGLVAGPEEPSTPRAAGIGAVVLPGARRVVESVDGRMTAATAGRGSGVHVMIPSLP
ncbi:MAG: hypothetical protein HYY76_09370 [Acidobacteria bacterium]|nr:hypothetical protein [Acidobacteriota bacterium]